MTPTQQHATLAAANCEVAFDNLTRQLYATDASHYQIEPIAVAFPRDARQASAIIQAAAQAGVSVIPRGAGTGLVGGAIGEGVVVDFSRYNRLITDFDPDKRTVRVGAGVVLDQLNSFLKPDGFAFGPDVATSSRATIGGMIPQRRALAALHARQRDPVSARKWASNRPRPYLADRLRTSRKLSAPKWAALVLVARRARRSAPAGRPPATTWRASDMARRPPRPRRKCARLWARLSERRAGWSPCNRTMSRPVRPLGRGA